MASRDIQNSNIVLIGEQGIGKSRLKAALWYLGIAPPSKTRETNADLPAGDDDVLIIELRLGKTDLSKLPR